MSKIKTAPKAPRPPALPDAVTGWGPTLRWSLMVWVWNRSLRAPVPHPARATAAAVAAVVLLDLSGRLSLDTLAGLVNLLHP